MKIQSLGRLLEDLQVWMEDHPRSTERVLLGVLLVSIVGLGFFLAMAVVMLVALAWGISREAALTMGILTLVLWLYSAALLYTQRSSDHAYSRKIKRWMHRAEGGDAAARWNLVAAYRDGGRGVRRDPGAYVWWLRKLSESGDRSAMLELAGFLREGHGVVKDRAQARAWLDRAAAAGDSEAKKLQTEWDQVGKADPNNSETE